MVAAPDWFDRLPKVELHLHLEGAIPVEDLWQLVRKYGGDAEVGDLEGLRRRFVFTDFRHFLRAWTWKNRFLREEEDFTFIAEAVARQLRREHIVYVEAFYSPTDFTARSGLTVQQITAALRRGLARVPEVAVALIVDLVRDHGPERGARTMAQALEVRDLGLIGIGIGGTEDLHPPGPFAPVFEQARQAGLRTTAHAGEGDGPESVWEAVQMLRVDRVGHGVAAIADDALVEHLAKHRIPLEVCPTSNLRTNIYPSMAEHPIEELARRGVVVTVNSDDPAMFHCSVAGDLRELSAVHNWPRQRVRDLQLAAVESSWLDPAGKLALRRRLVEDAAWLEEQVTAAKAAEQRPGGGANAER